MIGLSATPALPERGAHKMPVDFIEHLNIFNKGGFEGRKAAKYLGNLFLRHWLGTGVEKWSSGAGGLYRCAEFIPNAVLMAVILVVEDDIFILQSLEWVIEDLGHNSLLASDLAGALLHLAAPHHIDALFVDIRLDALAFGGYDVANQAIGLRPDLPVLYTSGSPLTDDMTGRFVPGGRFLQKPYSPAQLESFFGELFH